MYLPLNKIIQDYHFLDLLDLLLELDELLERLLRLDPDLETLARLLPDELDLVTDDLLELERDPEERVDPERLIFGVEDLLLLFEEDR